MALTNYYPSRNLIGMASKHMSEYCLSEVEANQVGISVPDTGVIVLIILFFIDKEPTISSTKLEYYLLLLDMKCFETRKITLFNWQLKGKRINNFKNVIMLHMIKKELISSKGRHSFQMTEKGQKIGQNFAMLANITYMLDEILSEWRTSTATSMKTAIIGKKRNPSYVKALENTRIAMDNSWERYYCEVNLK